MKTRWRWVVGGWAVLSGVGIVVACGSSAAPITGSFPDAGADATRGGTGSDGSTHGDASHGRDSAILHSPDASSHSPTDSGIDGACAVGKTPATVIPAYLVFVMDRSDSMQQYGKWPACSAALETFFSDPTTTGISSSLTFMPYVKPDAADTASHPGYSCTAADYATPEVPMTALPSTAFKPVISAEPLALGTPTRPAIQGALAYALTVKAAHPGSKVLLVLATDGYPAGCTDNTVENVADAAAVAANTDDIPVYVLGVGPASADDAGISKLNDVAKAGGTTSAFFIPTEVDGGDAGVTEQAFLAAVHQIQGSLGCVYSIPPPPAGQTLDFNAVNVVLSSSGSDTTLPYSASCANPGGWYYDNSDAGTPDKIILCSGACQSVKSTSSTSSISVVFGCATSGLGAK